MKGYKPLLVILLILVLFTMKVLDFTIIKNKKENSQVLSTSNEKTETLLVFSGAGLKKPMDDIGKVSMKLFEEKGIKDEVMKNLIASTATVNELIVYMTMGQADASIICEDNVKDMSQIEAIKIPEKENITKRIPII